MTTIIKDDAGKLTILPEGRVDGTNAPALEDLVVQNITGVKELEWDFGKLDYISSAGLRVLLKAQKIMNSQGTMKLTHVKEAVLDILSITGFADMLTIEHDESTIKEGILPKAICFAAEAYGDVMRKGDGSPEILHAMEAAAIASSMTQDTDVIVAAVLHDTIEDVGVTMDEIVSQFGPRVGELVASETEDKHREMPAAESWMMRKQETVQMLQKTDDLGIKILWLGDKLANMRSFYRSKIQLGDAMWEVFNQKDPEKHHWYYRTIADALKCLSDYPAWQEYNWLIERVFESTTDDKGEIKYGDL